MLVTCLSGRLVLCIWRHYPIVGYLSCSWGSVIVWFLRTVCLLMSVKLLLQLLGLLSWQKLDSRCVALQVVHLVSLRGRGDTVAASWNCRLCCHALHEVILWPSWLHRCLNGLSWLLRICLYRRWHELLWTTLHGNGMAARHLRGRLLLLCSVLHACHLTSRHHVL